MKTYKLAAACVVSLWCSIVAASCVSPKPEAEDAEGRAPAIETKDDDDVGSDPGVGSDPDVAPNWSFSPPADVPVDDPGPDPDPDPSSGAVPMGVGGYAARIPVRSPVGPQADPCDDRCDRDFEKSAGLCLWRETEAERRVCQASALATHTRCHQGCQQKNGDPCVEDCEWEKKDCDNQCRKIPKKKKREREACWAKCENEYADCLKRCKD